MQRLWALSSRVSGAIRHALTPKRTLRQEQQQQEDQEDIKDQQYHQQQREQQQHQQEDDIKEQQQQYQQEQQQDDDIKDQQQYQQEQEQEDDIKDQQQYQPDPDLHDPSHEQKPQEESADHHEWKYVPSPPYHHHSRQKPKRDIEEDRPDQSAAKRACRANITREHGKVNDNDDENNASHDESSPPVKKARKAASSPLSSAKKRKNAVAAAEGGSNKRFEANKENKAEENADYRDQDPLLDPKSKRRRSSRRRSSFVAAVDSACAKKRRVYPESDDSSRPLDAKIPPPSPFLNQNSNQGRGWDWFGAGALKRKATDDVDEFLPGVKRQKTIYEKPARRTFAEVLKQVRLQHRKVIPWYKKVMQKKAGKLYPMFNAHQDLPSVSLDPANTSTHDSKKKEAASEAVKSTYKMHNQDTARRAPKAQETMTPTETRKSTEETADPEEKVAELVEEPTEEEDTSPPIVVKTQEQLAEEIAIRKLREQEEINERISKRTQELREKESSEAKDAQDRSSLKERLLPVLKRRARGRTCVGLIKEFCPDIRTPTCLSESSLKTTMRRVLARYHPDHTRHLPTLAEQVEAEIIYTFLSDMYQKMTKIPANRRK